MVDDPGPLSTMDKKSYEEREKQIINRYIYLAPGKWDARIAHSAYLITAVSFVVYGLFNEDLIAVTMGGIALLAYAVGLFLKIKKRKSGHIAESEKKEND